MAILKAEVAAFMAEQRLNCESALRMSALNDLQFPNDRRSQRGNGALTSA